MMAKQPELITFYTDLSPPHVSLRVKLRVQDNLFERGILMVVLKSRWGNGRNNILSVTCF